MIDSQPRMPAGSRNGGQFASAPKKQRSSTNYYEYLSKYSKARHVGSHVPAPGSSVRLVLYREPDRVYVVYMDSKSPHPPRFARLSNMQCPVRVYTMHPTENGTVRIERADYGSEDQTVVIDEVECPSLPDGSPDIRHIRITDPDTGDTLRSIDMNLIQDKS